jgi:hypothetical protein
VGDEGRQPIKASHSGPSVEQGFESMMAAPRSRNLTDPVFPIARSISWCSRALLVSRTPMTSDMP